MSQNLSSAAVVIGALRDNIVGVLNSYRHIAAIEMVIKGLSFRYNKTAMRYTVKAVLSGHSERRPKLAFKTDYRLLQVKSIAECSNGSILQYFRPSLSYHLSLISLLCLFLIGCLRQDLLYSISFNTRFLYLSHQ